MKLYIFFSVIVFSAKNLFSQNFDLDFFPADKIYSMYFADALNHQFSLSKHLETSEWFGNIGADLALVDILIEQYKFQFSLGATSFNTLIKTPRHIQVYTVDYRVDFFIDAQLFETFIGRFIWGHLSAHYSDDGIIQLKKYPLDYVRDYIGLHFQHLMPDINGKIYAGGFYNFHNEPMLNKHFTYQIGGDAGTFINEFTFLYTAIDIKAKSEVNFGTTQSFQAGIRFLHLNNPNLRIAYTHRRGYEERGQLFNKKDIKNSIGIYLDF